MSSTTFALSALEGAPYAVQFAIFQHACTDGGRTGAALAHTSRSIAAAAAPFRFHSLHLTSLRQIGQLLLCHERIMRAHHASSFVKGKDKDTTIGPFLGLHQAQHLLLSFLPGPGCDAPLRQWRGWDEYSSWRHKQRDQMLEDERAWEAAKASWDRQFVFLVPQLFSLVAPTLLSLTVLQSADLPLPYVGGVQFPVLCELALLADDRMFIRAEPDRPQRPKISPRGSFDSGHSRSQSAPSRASARPSLDRTTRSGSLDATPRGSFDEGTLRGSSQWGASSSTLGSYTADGDAPHDCAAPFPALTHFHVVYEGVKAQPWERTLQRWSELAPAVTHLRVSQASKLVPEMLDAPTASFPRRRGPRDLRWNAWPPAPPPAPAGARAVLPFPNLERAIVQPFVLEPVRGHEMVEEAHVLSRTRRAHGGATVVLMRGRWFRQSYWQDRLRWAWEERMGGGLGCWAEREEDEGEWAYERRKRAEVAAAKTHRVLAGRAMAERVVSMIRLDQDERPALRPWAAIKQALAGIA